jgi:hypothetical protein
MFSMKPTYSGLEPAMSKAKLHKQRMAEIHARNITIVQSGVCPECGSGLRRNTALKGWWQCECYGRDDFRAPEYRGKPDCNFQCFVE